MNVPRPTDAGVLYAELARLLGFQDLSRHIRLLEQHHRADAASLSVRSHRQFLQMWREIIAALPEKHSTEVEGGWVFSVDGDTAVTNVYQLFHYDRVCDYVEQVCGTLLRPTFDSAGAGYLEKSHVSSAMLYDVRFAVNCAFEVHRDVQTEAYISQQMPERSRRLRAQYHMLRIMTGLIRGMYHWTHRSAATAMDDLESTLTLCAKAQEMGVRGEFVEWVTVAQRSAAIARLLCKAEYAMEHSDPDTALALYRAAAHDHNWVPNEQSRKLDELATRASKPSPLLTEGRLDPNAVEPRVRLSVTQRSGAYSEGLRLDRVPNSQWFQCVNLE